MGAFRHPRPHNGQTHNALCSPSKTVQQTRTYKVVGSGDQKEVIECKLDTKLANPTTATPPNTPCPSTTENVEATITIKAKPTTNDIINDEQENGEALNKKDDAEDQVVKKKKSFCSKCKCCSKCVIV